MDFSNIFYSCKEQLEPIEVETSGNLPAWLKGNYFINGPGMLDSGDFRVNHLFDGYAMICKFSLSEKVTFQSRFIDSDAYKKFKIHGKSVYQEFGTPGASDPDRNALGRFVSKFVPLDMTDNVCANLIHVGDELYACTETSYLHLIDQETLESKEKVDVSKIVGINVCCSHPHLENDGTIYNVGASFGTSVKYHVIKVEPPVAEDVQTTERKAFRKASILFTVPSRWSASYGYYHSFGMTDNYFVLIEQPYTANIPKLIASQMKGYAIKECLEWHPEHKTRFIVMDRQSKKVLKVKYMADPIFVLHHVNAYEENGQIIVDIVANQSPGVLNELFLDKIHQNPFSSTSNAQIQRFIIPIVSDDDNVSSENIVKVKDCDATAVIEKQNKVWLTSSLVSSKGFGVPGLNYSNVNTKNYKYVYGNVDIGDTSNKQRLRKVNVDTKEEVVWTAPENFLIMEPMFVKKPDSSQEDEGVLMCAALSLKKESNLLFIIDANTMEETAKITIPLGIDVPFFFHGRFIRKAN